jgi:hypothetical protein
MDDMLGWSAKTDNAIGATHTNWKCLIRLPMKYATGAILALN